jgi:hypothetical protein
MKKELKIDATGIIYGIKVKCIAPGNCSDCVFENMSFKECRQIPCTARERKDETSVHFILVKPKIWQCPYNKAVRCTLEDPCKGCETWAESWID